jgi:hypothetical protein
MFGTTIIDKDVYSQNLLKHAKIQILWKQIFFKKFWKFYLIKFCEYAPMKYHWNLVAFTQIFLSFVYEFRRNVVSLVSMAKKTNFYMTSLLLYLLIDPIQVSQSLS